MMKHVVLRSWVVPFMSLLSVTAAVAETTGAWWPAATEAVVAAAGENAGELRRALAEVPADQRESMQFLVDHMPPVDRSALKADFLLSHVALAHEAMAGAPWASLVPKDIFLNDVLPYASLNEARDGGRAKLREIALPLIKECRLPGEAAHVLNQKLFPVVNVRYSTSRKKPDQSALESMESGVATCSGLSILLVDACRAVGIPARVVGTPMWTNLRGNHTWVEVWDNGWHFAGAAEPDPNGLNRGWFVGDAAKADDGNPRHRIYASSFRPTGISFPLVWSRRIDWVPAVNVTQRYTGAAPAEPEGQVRVLVRVLDRPNGERVAARVEICDPAEAGRCWTGTSRDESADLNNILPFLLRPGVAYTLKVEAAGTTVTRPLTPGTEAEQITTVVLSEEAGTPSEPAKQTSAASAAAVTSGAWTQWRGSRADGVADGTGYPLTWSESENVRWKSPIPGRGWSSPVIADGRVWVTTAIEVPCTPEEAKERLKANTSDQPLTLLSAVNLRALGLDAATGRVVHDAELFVIKDPQWVHQQNSYASPTPVIAAGKLFAHFGTFGTACLDTATGSVLWRNQEIQLMHENGPGSSPVVWADKVIFHADGSDTQRIVALDAATGKLAWETKRSGELHPNPQLQKSYATPLVLERDGRPVLFSNGADWIYGYDPATGAELWRKPYGELGFSLSARPVEAHGLVIFSTGFMKPSLQAVKCGAVGEPELVWTVKKNVPTIPSPLVVGDHVFFLADQSMISCVDARTGEERFRERLGGNFNASLIAADGRLYATSREGVTHVLAATPEFKKLAENQLDGQQWATMAGVEGAFFVRTDSALYRIESQR